MDWCQDANQKIMSKEDKLKYVQDYFQSSEPEVYEELLTIEEVDARFEMILARYLDYSGEGEDAEKALREAYEEAKVQHETQRRASHAPYISHPVAVMEILSKVYADRELLIAALLHDVLEDTEFTEETIKNSFGLEVFNLVDGVTSHKKRTYLDNEEKRIAANFLKWMVNSFDEDRILLLKLADRLHNMRTMQHMNPRKQREKSKQTMELFAPVAERLGMWKWKRDLEELAFRYGNRERLEALQLSFFERMNSCLEAESLAKTQLSAILSACNLPLEFEIKRKHYYSLYRQLTQKEKTWDELVYFNVKIPVKDEATCYLFEEHLKKTVGVHRVQVSDYLRKAKANGYRALHLSYSVVQGIHIEVQLQTQGFAKASDCVFSVVHLARFLEMKHIPLKPQFQNLSQKTIANFTWRETFKKYWFSRSHLNDPITDLKFLVDCLALESIEVISPKEQRISFPLGSTALDFAFRISETLGLHAKSAVIDGKEAALETKLRDNMRVEILFDEKHFPTEDCLSKCTTAYAQNALNRYFEKENLKKQVERRKQALELQIASEGMDPAVLINDEALSSYYYLTNTQNLNELLAVLVSRQDSSDALFINLRNKWLLTLSEEARNHYGYTKTPYGTLMKVRNKRE